MDQRRIGRDFVPLDRILKRTCSSSSDISITLASSFVQSVPDSTLVSLSGVAVRFLFWPLGTFAGGSFPSSSFTSTLTSSSFIFFLRLPFPLGSEFSGGVQFGYVSHSSTWKR